MTDIDIDAIRHQASDLLVARRACASNGACERCSARARDLALAMPDFCFGFEQTHADLDFARNEAKNIYGTLKTIERERDELTAALTQSREQAATYANEIGTLTAENARLRQQRDEASWANRIGAQSSWDHCGPGGVRNPHPLHPGKDCIQYDADMATQAATR